MIAAVGDREVAQDNAGVVDTAALCVFAFRVSSWVCGNGFANRILKTQGDVPGRFPRSLLVDRG